MPRNLLEKKKKKNGKRKPRLTGGIKQALISNQMELKKGAWGGKIKPEIFGRTGGKLKRKSGGKAPCLLSGGRRTKKTSQRNKRSQCQGVRVEGL